MSSKADLNQSANNPSRELSNLQLSFERHPIVVLLGNAGINYAGERPFGESIRVRNIHPNWNLVGIDYRPAEGPPWIQLQADFLGGLNWFRDISVARISSSYSLGYYSDTGQQEVFELSLSSSGCDALAVSYAARVIRKAYDKLLPGGTISLVAGEAGIEILRDSICRLDIPWEGVRERELSAAACKKSYWTRYYHERMMTSKEILLVKSGKRNVYLRDYKATFGEESF